MAASETPTIIASEKTVTAAGTAEALASAQRVRSVTIIAKTTNTGQVYVGGSDVASTTNDGLNPGDELEIPADNELVGQLAALRYTFNSLGQLVMESKEDMRRRGVPSPDKADALMMAFMSNKRRVRLWG